MLPNRLPLRFPGTLGNTLAAYPRPFWVLLVGTLVNRLGLVVLPYLTLFLTRVHGYTAAESSLVVGLFGVGMFGANAVGGVMADRLGRRPTVLISLVGGAGVLLTVPSLHSPIALSLAVMSMGLFGEMYRPAVAAAISDLVPEARRTQAFAMYYWIVNLGAAVAPAIGGFLAEQSFTFLFYLDASTLGAYALFVVLGVPESRPSDASAHRTARPSPVSALRDRALVVHSLLFALIAAIFYQTFTTLPLAMSTLGLSPSAFGLAMATNGALIVVFSLLVARYAGKMPPARMLAIGAFIISIGFSLKTFASSTAGFAGAIAVWTFGEMMLIPTSASLVAKLAPKELRGAYQGAFGASWALAALAGPAVGGYLFGTGGSTLLWPFCGVMALISSLGYVAYRKRLATRLDAAPTTLAEAA